MMPCLKDLGEFSYYLFFFSCALVFIILGVGVTRTALGMNDHIHLFDGGSASYVADYSCTIDAPLTRSVEDMQEAFDECLKLHKEYQNK